MTIKITAHAVSNPLKHIEFEDYDEYETLIKDARLEWHFFEFYQGDPLVEWLFNVIRPENNVQLEKFFDLIDDITHEYVVALEYKLTVEGCDLDTAIAEYQDVYVYCGDSEEFVAHHYEESGLLRDLPDTIRFNIDWAGVVRDWECDGSIHEMDGYVVVR